MSRRSLPHILALLLYLILAILVTWPLAAYARTAVIGLYDAGDTYQNIWNQWWITRTLTSFHSPFFTDRLYYPEGVDLFWQTLGLSQGIVGLPVSLVFGPLAAVNVTLFLSFVVGGYAVFLLTRRLTHSAVSGIVAGAIYAFSPYHLQKLNEGSVELTSIQWLPFYVWALDALLEKPTVRRVLLASALLLWVSLGAWYYGLFAVLFTGCAAAVRVIRELGMGLADSAMSRRQVLRQASVLAAWGLAPLLLWALVLSPNIVALSQTIDRSSWDFHAAQVSRSADLVDFALPSPLHPVWGEQVRSWRTTRSPDLQIYWNVSLGLVGLALALVGLTADWRHSWRWGVLLLATMLLAMGPLLRVAGVQTAIPLPFALIQDLPGVRIGQRPSHMAVLASLMVAILAAYGVARLTRGRSARAAVLIGAVLVSSCVLVDGLIAPERLTLYERRVHSFYASLPPPDGVLMALPMYVNINRSEHLTNQMVHGWPIFAGYIARPPAYRLVYETDGVSQLRDGRAEPDDIVSPGWPESGRRALAALRVRYVTLDLTSQRGDPKLAAGKPEYFAAVRQLLAELGVGAPLVADSDLEAYAIPREWQVGPIISLGSGWRALEHDAAGLRWRWMGPQATLRIYNPYAQPVRATLRLNAASFEQRRTLGLSLNGQAIGSMAIDPAPSVQQVVLLIPPGEQIITLAAATDPDPAQAGALLSLRLFSLSADFGQPLR